MNKRLFAAALLLACSLAGCSKETERTEPPPPETPQEIQQEPVEPQKSTPVSVQAEAEPVSVEVYIDGKTVNLSAYQINGSNFLPLRDIAVLLNGSRVQYEVGWDNATKTILLTSGKPYTETGGELGDTSGGSVTVWSNTAPLLLDGEEIFLENYTIDGTNYFSLREIAETFDFSLGWFSAVKKVTVNTTKSYGEEPLALEDGYSLIVDSRPLYEAGMDGLWEQRDGLCYADYIDFDGDGTKELTLVTASLSGYTPIYNSIDISVEVYGDKNGSAEKIAQGEFSVKTEDRSLSIYDMDGRAYIGTHYVSHSMWGQEESRTYSGIRNGEFTVEDAIGYEPALSDDIDGNVAYQALFSGEELTEDQYNSIIKKYDNRILHISVSDKGRNLPVVETSSRGILPEMPELSVTVNGEKIDFGTDLIVKDAHILAPPKPVLEKLGVTVCEDYEDFKKTCVASTKKDSLLIYKFGGDFDDGTYYVDFNDEDMQIWGQTLADDRPAVPVKAVAQLFGAQAAWDAESRTLVITGNIPDKDRISKEELNSVVEFSTGYGYDYQEAKHILNQHGYQFCYSDFDFDIMTGFKNGKSYWDMSAVPVGTIQADFDSYSLVRIWSDGTFEVLS